MTETPQILGGRYELGATIGRGGMAQVSRARDTKLQRDVAVKQLRIDLAGDPTFQARFRREAHASAGLNHPNIVSVYDTGEELDPASKVSVPYIVMELVEGQTLRDILRTGRKIIPGRALEFTQGVLDALNYSHKAGIVHRDIKPANVMLTKGGQIKVMDFGIARAVSDTSATMTQTAAVIGTAQYLSPEQARGETVDARSDIYSAGCLMYELLVGRPPFQGDSPVSVAYQHVREDPVPPSQIDPLITSSMDTVVLKALAKDPAHRYQTAAAMRADIGRLLAGQDVQAAAPPVLTEAQTQVLVQTPEAATALLPQTPAAPARAMPPRTAVMSVDSVPVEPEHTTTRWWWWLLVLVAVAAIVGGFFLLQQGKGTGEVEVPALFQKSAAEAKDTLTALNLAIKVMEVPGPNDATIDKVTKQDPVPKSMVAPGTTVTVWVNKGPKQVTVPATLVGKDKAAVEAELRDLGFTEVALEVDTQTTDKKKENVVTRLNVEPGASVGIDKKIIVYYASGQIRIPNFISLAKEQALAEADRAGLGQVTIETKESTSTEGTVIAQNPLPGAMAKVGDPVTMVVAIPVKPTPTPVPPNTPTISPTPKATG